jgi:hypothetical protein
LSDIPPFGEKKKKKFYEFFCVSNENRKGMKRRRRKVGPSNLFIHIRGEKMLFVARLSLSARPAVNAIFSPVWSSHREKGNTQARKDNPDIVEK